MLTLSYILTQNLCKLDRSLFNTQILVVETIYLTVRRTVNNTENVKFVLFDWRLIISLYYEVLLKGMLFYFYYF